MQFLIVGLFFAVVAGNIFQPPFLAPTKPFSPAYQPFLINEGYYYYPTQPKDCGDDDSFSFYDYFPYYACDTNLQQGIFSVGQQRSPMKKNDRDPSVWNWQRKPVQSKGLSQRSRWNQKFFLLDNDAETVYALRPVKPLEMLNFQFSQIKPSSPLTRPMFARRTAVMTITQTTSTTDTRICISSNLFTDPSNVTICPMMFPLNRLVKSSDFLEDDKILSSPTSGVVATLLTTASQRSPVHAIESSKDDRVNEGGDSDYYDLEEFRRKERAMFGMMPTATVTTLLTSTFFVTRVIDPVFPSIGAQVGPLICIPPGILVCASKELFV